MQKVSQFKSRAARLNEVFSVVKRVPIVRPALPGPAAGFAPSWPMMSLRWEIVLSLFFHPLPNGQLPSKWYCMSSLVWKYMVIFVLLLLVCISSLYALLVLLLCILTLPRTLSCPTVYLWISNHTIWFWFDGPASLYCSLVSASL